MKERTTPKNTDSGASTTAAADPIFERGIGGFDMARWLKTHPADEPYMGHLP
jgi:hypothetical protein